ncbi:MAG: S-adenosylmethionine:tRNA ribosyltransferase-isomerase [Bacteroidales bacterium]|nr:S-adenosylmethionine:tRNA ribosyltransferase-isomerase [Bacteroidales bacterium]
MKNEDFIRHIYIDDYDYILPEERIAQYPAPKRDNSKLLLYNKGNISKDHFGNIHKYLPGDSLMVFNNTRVIRARIIFHKETGADIEVFCLEPLSPCEYEQSFGSRYPVEWKCIVGNLKKWKNGTLFTEFDFSGCQYKLSAQKIQAEGAAWRILFSWNSSRISFGEVIEAVGRIPLPPYVKRDDEDEDYVRYQTIYSTAKGSVAAPTAGLHFTKEVFDHIYNKGIKSVELTLHVGAGTFQPVKARNILQHEMHSEHFFVTGNTIEELLSYEGKIIAVGTTSVRTLESIYWLGVKVISDPSCADSDLFIGQFEPYNLPEGVSVQKSLESLAKLIKKRNTTVLHASTKIMIMPGYEFRMISGMITNFHQPKSTLLLLISAWMGSDWKNIYSFALKNDFRFLSYGDSSLLIK